MSHIATCIWNQKLNGFQTAHNKTLLQLNECSLKSDNSVYSPLYCPRAVWLSFSWNLYSKVMCNFHDVKMEFNSELKVGLYVFLSVGAKNANYLSSSFWLLHWKWHVLLQLSDVLTYSNVTCHHKCQIWSSKSWHDMFEDTPKGCSQVFKNC